MGTAFGLRLSRPAGLAVLPACVVARLARRRRRRRPAAITGATRTLFARTRMIGRTMVRAAQACLGAGVASAIVTRSSPARLQSRDHVRRDRRARISLDLAQRSAFGVTR